MVEQRVARRRFGWAACIRQCFQALPAELGIVVVAKAVGEFLVERPRHRRVALFFGETRTPVERGGNFRGIGIERDLIFETLPGLLRAALPESEPGRLPVGNGSVHATRETLLQFAEAVD